MKYLYKTISREGSAVTATIIINDEGRWCVEYAYRDHYYNESKESPELMLNTQQLKVSMMLLKLDSFMIWCCGSLTKWKMI